MGETIQLQMSKIEKNNLLSATYHNSIFLPLEVVSR